MSAEGLGFLDDERPSIVMFCGKGGVGKTTSASATALHFAQRGLHTLLFSSDPTPSLSDILEIDVRGKITSIGAAPGLDAVELDYDTVVEMWKEKFGDEVYDVISSFLPVDEEIIEYVANAPGIDQEFALSYIYDLYTGVDYDAIVWDTAPAGGTLSLINLQDKFYRHLGDAARLYVRVRSALEALTRGRAKRDPLRIIAEWEELAKSVLEMLKDEGTRAFLVTIPEALGVNQTRRVAKELERFGVNVSGVIVNYVLTPEIATSEFNMRRREMQLKYIEEIEARYGGAMRVVLIPLLPFEVKGVEALGEVEKLLFPSRRSSQ
ncbi:MAG: ArsA family ATPase [Candidatus Bathyarchaeota archaeon]|nr:ArsA family ATPase [Candidatus Bathyarchaeota archaeon]